MKKYLFMLTLLCSLLSCELFTPDKTADRTVHLVSVGLSYENTNIVPLEGTLNDQNAIISEFRYLSREENSAFISYKLTQNNTGYTYTEESNPKLGESYRYEESLQGGMKSRLINVLEGLSDYVQQGDLVIFYYAGHGVGVKESETEILYLNGALVLGDLYFPDIGDWRELAQNQSELMDLMELKRYLLPLKSQVVIIMDSCYSGAVVKDDIALAPDNDINRALSLTFSAGEKTKRGIWELSAAREYEKSFESEEGGIVCHGKFTYALLDAMGYSFFDGSYESPGRPEDGRISLSNLYDTIKGNLGADNQHPDCSQTIRDLVLFNLK